MSSDRQREMTMDRRRILATSGALAGIMVGGRLHRALAQDGTPAASPVASPTADGGVISGTVTDLESGEPIEGVYVVVGWRDVQLAAITDVDGNYTVRNVPSGAEVDVLGFHDGGYRYHNSYFDADMAFTLQSGESAAYDFQLALLNQPEGEPQLSDPVIDPQRVAPGDEVTFEVTAKGGQGGLSPEVIAANPEIGRMVLMESVGGDRFRTTVTIASDAAPGDYPFAFFAASNECFVNSEFPMTTLHVEGAAASPRATPEAQASPAGEA